jgi:hemerythrin
MAHIQWKDRYNINFREIDAQHRGLLDLINELGDLMDGGSHPKDVARIFLALGDYAQTHFSSEERYMQAANYPKLAQHRQEHVTFVNRVKELSRDYNPGDIRQVEETSAFLRDWYLGHITKIDQEYVPYLKRALPTASIEGILFGLDGMVCAFDPAPLVKAMAEASGRTEAEAQAALWEEPGLLRELENGNWDLDRFDMEFASWAAKSGSTEALVSGYTASFQPVAPLLRFAERLKTYQSVALVGNATPWMRTEGISSLGLEGVFNAEVFSCEVSTRLPSKAFFLAAAERLKLAPDTCLLIHRDPACLDAAQDAQLQTLHYTNPVMVMSELRRMGVPF